jgi:hypothetical protein
MRRWSRASGGLVIMVSAVFLFANWKSSPLHLRVCGPDSSGNLRWFVNGRLANDNWPAKFCGCEVPAVFAEAIRRGFDSNLGALQIERDVKDKAKLRQYLAQLGFGRAVR